MTPAPAHGSNNFDALRLVGALLVLISHQFALSARPEPLLAEGVSLGGVGLAMFFGMSGYLVSASWSNDPHFMRFAQRRLLRIWPGLAVVTATIFVCTGGLAVLKNLVFVFGDVEVFSKNPHRITNGSIWTIPYEVKCYLIVVFCGVLLRKRSGVVLAIVLALWTGYLMLGFPGMDFTQNRWAFQMPRLAAWFIVGAVLFHFPALRSWRSLGLMTFVAGLAAMIGANEVVPLVLAQGAVVVGLQSWRALGQASRFGDLSYGAYLWAWPVEQVGVAWLGRDTSIATLLSLTVASTLLLAWLSWNLVEKPALRLKPRTPRHPSGPLIPAVDRAD